MAENVVFGKYVSGPDCTILWIEDAPNRERDTWARNISDLLAVPIRNGCLTVLVPSYALFDHIACFLDDVGLMFYVRTFAEADDLNEPSRRVMPVGVAK